MRSGKFWHFIPNPGYEKFISSKIKLKTSSEVKRAIQYVYLDEDLFDFLKSRKYRDSLLAVLVSRWFPGRLCEIQKILDSDEFRNPPISIEKIEAQLKSEKWL
jgi:putative restriction endonuclease